MDCKIWIIFCIFVDRFFENNIKNVIGDGKNEDIVCYP